MILLRTLDQCAVETDRARIGPEAEIVFALLLLLSLERGKRIARTTVVELFWRGADEENARHCLRQTLYKARQLGAPVESTAADLHLPVAAVQRDFDPLFAPSTWAVDDGVATPIGDFLPGYAPHISPRFTDWLDQQRTYVHAGVRRALLAALLDRRARGSWLEVEALARRCLQLDPLNEEATLALAEAAAMSGAKAQAIRILDTFLAELGPGARDIRLPAAILRKRIAERLPFPRYTASESCFVGRAESMALLASRLSELRGGRGGGCLVWGEAGMGKTRLTQEFARVATLDGAQVQRIKCQASDPGRPLSAFVDVVPALLALPGALGCSPRSLGYLKRLTEHDPAVLEPTEETRDAEFLHASIRQSVFDLVDAVCGEAPLVLVVEDVHWLDRLSWGLLREMIEWAGVHPLLVVLTSRTPGVTPDERLDSPRGFERHALAPLDHAAASELVDTLLREQRRLPDPRVRDWCLRTGDGNPLYLRELVAHWLERGDASAVPPTLATLIDDRVTRLRPGPLRLFQACAVLGNHSSLERLERLLERKAHELVSELEELDAYGVLAPDAARALCRHDLLAASALARLADAPLRLLHRRAGTLLEAELERSPSATLLWDCARHWRLAGDDRRALALARSCGVHLLELGLPEDSAAVFEGALEYSATLDDRLDLLACQVYALKHAGKWQRVRDVCDAVAELRRGAGLAPTCHDDLELDRLEAGWRLNEDLGGLLKAGMLCSGCSTAYVAHRVRAAALALVFSDNLGNAELSESIYYSVRPLLPNPRVDPLAGLRVQLVYHTVFGDLAEAHALGVRIVETSRERSNASELTQALRYAAHAWRYAGDIEAATNALLECYELAEKFRVATAASTAAERLSLLHLDSGDIQSSAAWLQRAHAWVEEDAMTRDNLATLLARVRIAQGATTSENGFISEAPDRFLSDTILRRRIERAAVWLMHATSLDPANSQLTIVREDLQFNHFALRSRGGQDFPAYALYRAMQCSGNSLQARSELLAYVNHFRRERSPVPKYIEDTLSE